MAMLLMTGNTAFSSFLYVDSIMSSLHSIDVLFRLLPMVFNVRRSEDPAIHVIDI